MERIHNLLRKLQDIYYKQEEKQVIDIDLMLDYTRVLYADLLDTRTDLLAKQGMGLHLKQEPVVVPAPIPEDEPESKTGVAPAAMIAEEPALATPAPEETDVVAEQEEPATVPEAVPQAENKEGTEDKEVAEEASLAAAPVAEEPAATGLESNETPEVESNETSEEVPEEADEDKEQHVINDDDYPRLDSDIEPLKEEPVFSEIHFELPEVKDNASESPKQGYVFQHKLKDIRSFIGINDKYQYMNELFANNKTAYEESLDKIAFCNDLKEAETWLATTAAERYGWQKDDETYLSLIETVRKYFAA
ncbi:MAG: hypothetical protein BGO31_01395 [Bacteroidetes bacterium 43-16]|nr:MAG: hypothetical protein BGO31_01395 [Bacteroidetes bacterium 43-16]